MIAAEFAWFLGFPVLRSSNTTDLTEAVVGVCTKARTGLVLVDEIHNILLQTRTGADASDTLKCFSERIPATFAHAGIDIEDSSLLTGTRGEKIAARFTAVDTRPFPYNTEWKALVAQLEAEPPAAPAPARHPHPPGPVPAHPYWRHHRHPVPPAPWSRRRRRPHRHRKLPTCANRLITGLSDLRSPLLPSAAKSGRRTCSARCRQRAHRSSGEQRAATTPCPVPLPGPAAPPKSIGARADVLAPTRHKSLESPRCPVCSGPSQKEVVGHSAGHALGAVARRHIGDGR